MFLLVHDVIGKSIEEFGEDLEDLLRFEIFGGVGHDHGNWFFEEMEESILIISFAKIDRHPVSEFFIGWSSVHWFLDKGFDRDIVKVHFSFFDESSSGNFRYFYSQTKLILTVVEFGMEARQFFPDEIVFFLNNFKFWNYILFLIEGGPKG